MDITELKEKIEKHDVEVEKIVNELFAVGTYIFFKKGGAEIAAKVTIVGLAGRSLKVRNIHTDREYWIDIYFALQDLKEAA